ncbi:hypothetical protein PMY38_07650 [Clostridium tertium]|jgi:hypothetical protein|uniref:hypothetical protein n=1 Tax=Clostridium TaxID=1485 RepID=UPI001C1DE3B9|nr:MULTISPECIES: hypothetical protein [Clostridium]MBU6134901.1 hypothetical protein [Clostridium tertium]MDB1956596.1 hypothetical protein [Clostridium tertium]MDB1958467.1 hypothetical protein [Clostridium tertium]MDB1962358.1 hypothetical protein [Clostridium tertium]MDB1967648.1 hypothetical protein [Clostridium tertium]
MDNYYIALVYIVFINTISNIIITIYLEQISKSKDRLSSLNILFRISYPLLASTIGPILVILIKLV